MAAAAASTAAAAAARHVRPLGCSQMALPRAAFARHVAALVIGAAGANGPSREC